MYAVLAGVWVQSNEIIISIESHSASSRFTFILLLRSFSKFKLIIGHTTYIRSTRHRIHQPHIFQTTVGTGVYIFLVWMHHISPSSETEFACFSFKIPSSRLLRIQFSSSSIIRIPLPVAGCAMCMLIARQMRLFSAPLSIARAHGTHNIILYILSEISVMADG